MVKAIINNHQGTIDAVNLPEGGTVFTIAFPLHLTDRSTFKEIDVLIIISDEVFRYPQQVFQATGFSTEVNEPFELGNGMVRNYKPRIVITDQCLDLETQDNLEKVWPGLHGLFIGEPRIFYPAPIGRCCRYC